ncbi:MAG: V-type ATP synthase subunit A [Synergistaceae bacterium]|nr:V-type ATP synthase subunit A [Synergistaceae bacterium]
MENNWAKGAITGVSGPVITAETDSCPRMFEAVWIAGGALDSRAIDSRTMASKLPGEVVRIRGKTVDIQTYGDTTGLAAGGEVYFTGKLLSVDLGPGFLGQVLDGLGRSLGSIESLGSLQGGGAPDLPLWHFTPAAAEGNTVAPGDLLGTVEEGKLFIHRILVPPVSSPQAIAWIAPEGDDYTRRECICRLADGTELSLAQRWEVRVPRPVRARLPLDRPLWTGRRGFDTLFPLAVGGVAAVAGGVGTGKTLVQRSLAAGCDADVIVYVGCGGRGSETAEMLEEFSQAERRGIPLRERTIFVTSTSSMTVAARDPGIYLGMTLAEYYRDMGCDAVVVIDSLSRWAEALREIGNRLEESPGEGGYPAYLGSRLSSYCERGGQAETLGGHRGSVTLISGFSPEGGDFSEPVTQTGLSRAGACWRLDKVLAQARRFPAMDLARSYSLYEEAVSDTLAQNAGQDWPDLKEYLRDILSRARELFDSARFAPTSAFAPIFASTFDSIFDPILAPTLASNRSAGEIALSEEDRWILFHAETIETVYLRQNVFDLQDSCPARSAAMLRLLKALDDRVRSFLKDGLPAAARVSMRAELAALWDLPGDFTDKGREWLALFTAELAARQTADQEVAL